MHPFVKIPVVSSLLCPFPGFVSYSAYFVLQYYISGIFVLNLSLWYYMRLSHFSSLWYSVSYFRFILSVLIYFCRSPNPYLLKFHYYIVLYKFMFDMSYLSSSIFLIFHFVFETDCRRIGKCIMFLWCIIEAVDSQH